MKIQMKTSTLSFILLLASSQAFVPSSRTFQAQRFEVTHPAFAVPPPSVLRATTDSTLPDPNQSNGINADEVQRLRAMAQQLRNDAAELAAEQAQKVSEAALKTFTKFDLDSDGTISVEELKVGLEKAIKSEIPQNRIEKLLQKFDANGDGVLQLEEFVSVDRLKNQLDFIVQEEKAVALEEAKLAQKMEEEEKQREMIMSLVNEGEPTASDKLLSVLPYLFPLLDSLRYAAPWITSHPDNILAQVAVLALALYRSVPFGGFLAFFFLSSRSRDLSLNRLVRFNIQQAIFLDVALFFVGLISIGLGAVGSALPASEVVTEYLNDAVALGTLASVLYASATSLLGNTPDQLPWVSDSAKRRIITRDMLVEGKFIDASQKGDEEEKQ